MKKNQNKNLSGQAKAEGYCIMRVALEGYCTACVALILNVLLTQVYEQEAQEKCFSYIKKFAPEVTWEEYWDSVNGPMRGFAVAQKMFPKLTEKMYKVIVESYKDEYDIFAYIHNYMKVFKNSPPWKQAVEQFNERKGKTEKCDSCHMKPYEAVNPKEEK